MTKVDDARHRERIRSAEAPARFLVEAGPGTGKTEMAALRMANLIQTGVSPGQMLVLSFSRSAVRNLTHRLARVTSTQDAILEDLRHVSIRTFDSWAFRILRLLGHSTQTLLARKYDENIAELTRQLRSAQKDRICALIGDKRHLIVDEFQDLPGVRGELVLVLLEILAPPGQPGAGFTILGDPAQAIYGFAANAIGEAFPTPVEYWKRITDAYGPELEKISLTHNYRAATPLANLASSLRQVLLSQIPDGEKLRIVQDIVAALPSSTTPVNPKWLNNGDARSRAILTRTNGESLRVLKHLFGDEVEGGATPVHLRAGNYTILPPAWVAALLSYLRSPELTKSQFNRIYHHLTREWDDTMCRYLGLPSEASTWARLCWASGAPEDATRLRVSDLRSRLDWPDAFPDDQLAGEDGLVVTTIHQSKGLEFDIVTVLDTPSTDANDDALSDRPNDPAVLEEANVHYVAVTRAARELNRLDGNQLYKAPRTWTLPSNRERLCHWQNGWMNVEIGLRGDLDPFGFVDTDLHGGTEAVVRLQDFLLRNVCALQGHKVMLCKQTRNRKALWHIHVQEGDGLGRLIGRTTPQLTYDLLHMLYGRGFVLPMRIMNLRIAAVGTVTTDAEFPLKKPYRTSRLWLGVSLFGTGDFRTRRRNR